MEKTGFCDVGCRLDFNFPGGSAAECEFGA